MVKESDQIMRPDTSRCCKFMWIINQLLLTMRSAHDVHVRCLALCSAFQKCRKCTTQESESTWSPHKRNEDFQIRNDWNSKNSLVSGGNELSAIPCRNVKWSAGNPPKENASKPNSSAPFVSIIWIWIQSIQYIWYHIQYHSCISVYLYIHIIHIHQLLKDHTACKWGVRFWSCTGRQQRCHIHSKDTGFQNALSIETMPLSDPPLAAQRPLACKELIPMDYARNCRIHMIVYYYAILLERFLKTSHIQSCNVASPPGWYQVHPLKLGAQGTRATQSKRSGRTVFTQGLKCCFGFVQVPKCRHVEKTSL